MNFIITGFDESYWNPWGASWLASLKEFAKTKATLVVIDHGISKSIKQNLQEKEVVVYPSCEKGNFRNSTIATIVNLSEEMQGNFIYYDCDVWFQNSIDEIFDIINNKILMCNSNYGFLAGNSDTFRRYKIASKLAKFIKDDNVFDCFVKYYDYDIEFIDQKYNYTNLPNLYLKEDCLCSDYCKPLAIHPTGILKHISRNKKLFFHEKFPELFQSYVYYEKSKLPKKLFKKT